MFAFDGVDDLLKMFKEELDMTMERVLKRSFIHSTVDTTSEQFLLKIVNAPSITPDSERTMYTSRSFERVNSNLHLNHFPSLYVYNNAQHIRDANYTFYSFIMQ